MRILVLASDNPSPPINGTRIRNFHLWMELRKLGHEVKVLAITRNQDDLKLSSETLEFYPFTRRNIFLRIWMRFFHSYHEWPVSETLKKRVDYLIEEWRPEIIHAEELRMGYYLPPKSKNPKTLLSLCIHNVETELIKKTLASPLPFAKGLFNKLYRFNLMRFEKKIFHNSDILMTYSEVDTMAYQLLYPNLTFMNSSNGVNLIELNPEELSLPPSRNLLFLGSLSYLPNIEGLFWLLDKVLPTLDEEVYLTVAGSTPAPIVKERLKQLGIKLLDTPLNLRPVYLENSLLLVPLLSGSGTRGKILESLMYGRPVLTTSKGVEGLNLKQREGILIADEAHEFANSIKTWVNTSPEERNTIAQAGRAAVVSKYTWKDVGKQLLNNWEMN